LYHCTPNTCTIVPPTSCHCTIHIVSLHPLHRTIVPPISYQWTPNTVTYIVPSTWYHCGPISYHCTPYIGTSYHRTPFILPLLDLYRTIAPLNRTIAPPTSYHCTAYIAPLYPSYCTSCTWCTCITVPLRCLHCTIAPALRTPVPALRTPWKPSSYLPPDYLSEQCFWNLIII
jgi:hypothetical protein